MKTVLQWKMAGIAGILVLVATGAVRAQFVGSLAVGNLTPVTNALGCNLPTGSRVEILEAAPGGIIMPPDPETGEGNTNSNPLVRMSYIGHDVIGANTGMFSETFDSRLEIGKTYFARVYDASLPSRAIYFANSALFQEPAGDVGSLDVVFQQPLRLIRTSQPDVDTDGDGIPDDMEMDMGLDPNNPDTDGDGYGDFFESVHDEYLSANEPDDPLVIQINSPAPAGADPYTVSWDTIPVPGMEYRLEYTDELPYEGIFTAVITNVTATDTNVEIDVDSLVRTNSPIKGFFRVLVP